MSAGLWGPLHLLWLQQEQMLVLLLCRNRLLLKIILDFLKVECIPWWNETRVFKKSVHLGTVSPKTSSALSLHGVVRG